VADVRLFVADETGDDISELTSGGGPVVRFAARDLLRAQRGAARLRADGGGVAVILDIAVAVPGDFRSAGDDETVRYAGTVDGLTGLIADIDLADVADGVTLVPATGLPPQDLRRLGHDVLRRLAMRERASA
jgi:hypothetical protein